MINTPRKNMGDNGSNKFLGNVLALFSLTYFPIYNIFSQTQGNKEGEAMGKVRLVNLSHPFGHRQEYRDPLI